MGLVGNLLMGVLLLRKSLNTNFHQTILALTVVNLLFVVMIVVDSFHPDLNLENQLYIRLFPYLWHPVKAILLCCETYLVMSITMERYLAVKLPVRLHMVNLHHHSHFRHFATFILPPIAIAFLVNVPKFFEFRLTKVNMFFGAKDLVDWVPTDLRLSSDYIFYYNHWTRLILTGILPFLHILVLNIKICTILARRNSRLNSNQSLGGDAVPVMLQVVLPISNRQQKPHDLKEIYCPVFLQYISASSPAPGQEKPQPLVP